MAEVTLSTYLETHTQQEAAAALGCTQGAVSQMVKAARDIRLCLDGEGRVVSHYERKLPGRRVAVG